MITFVSGQQLVILLSTHSLNISQYKEWLTELVTQTPQASTSNWVIQHIWVLILYINKNNKWDLSEFFRKQPSIISSLGFSYIPKMFLTVYQVKATRKRKRKDRGKNTQFPRLGMSGLCKKIKNMVFPHKDHIDSVHAM